MGPRRVRNGHSQSLSVRAWGRDAHHCPVPLGRLRAEAESRFPRPIRIGSRAVRWVEQEVLDFIASGPTAAPSGPPRSRDARRSPRAPEADARHPRHPGARREGRKARPCPREPNTTNAKHPRSMKPRTTSDHELLARSVATMLPRLGSIRGDWRGLEGTTAWLERDDRQRLIARSPLPSLNLENHVVRVRLPAPSPIVSALQS